MVFAPLGRIPTADSPIAVYYAGDRSRAVSHGLSLRGRTHAICLLAIKMETVEQLSRAAHLSMSIAISILSSLVVPHGFGLSFPVCVFVPRSIAAVG